MFKRFTLWFITFGLSFLLAGLFGSQGKAFFAIYLGTSTIFVLSVLAAISTAGAASGLSFITDKLATMGVVELIKGIAVILLATWGATKLFGIDFFVSYQIMTFGQCLCGSSNKDD